jgi:hypothetical protein
MAMSVTHAALLCTALLHPASGAAQAQPAAGRPLSLRAASSSPLADHRPFAMKVFGGSNTLNAPQRAGSRSDSLTNGTAIGAVVGAAAAFGVGMYLCHAIREEGDPPCLKPVLALTGAGGAAGAVIGAGVDAMQMRGPSVRFLLRF